MAPTQPHILPIHTLDPSSPPSTSYAIRAIVTLSWPYSSTTKQCALLLSDPDFRLRNKRGQVRVRFSGACARAVAQARIGIGDELVLNLAGGVWEEDLERERTPGSGVEKGLWFGKGRAEVRVRKSGLWEDVRVEEEEEREVVEFEERERGVVKTPAPKEVGRLGEAEGGKGWTFASPAFAKKVRLSGEDLVYSAYDPFAVKATELEKDDYGMRRSFGARTNWRWCTGNTPSPTKEAFDEVEVSPTRPASHVEGTSMLPPPLSRLEVPADATQQQLSRDDAPSTPELLPIKSPNLPLPSPFPTEVTRVPFGAEAIQPAVIGPAPTHEQRREDDVRLEMPAIAQGLDDERKQHTDVVDLLSQSEAEDEDEERLDAQPVTTLEQIEDMRMGEYTMDANYIPDNLTEAQQHQLDLLEPGIHQRPVTSTTPQKPSAIAFDGTSSAPASTHVTPQSEKDRVMRRTFQSLFGFKGSPEPQGSFPREDVESVEGPSLSGDLLDMQGEKIEAARDALGEASTVAPGVFAPARENTEEKHLSLEDRVHEEVVATAHTKSPSPATRKSIEVIELDSDSEEEEGERVEDSLVRGDVQQPHQAPAISPTFSLEVQGSYEDFDADDLVKAAREGTLEVSENISHLTRADAEPELFAPDEDGEVDTDAVAVDEALLQLEEPLQHRVSATSLSPSLQPQVPQPLEPEFALQPLDTAVQPVTAEPEMASHETVVEQLEPPRSTAATTAAVIELDSSSPVEALPSSPLYPSLPLDLTQDPAESQPAEITRQQSISYPSLPMSPSNSQTLNEMSQTAADTHDYEISTTTFPPTPQLTQAGSSMRVQEDTEQRTLEDLPEEVLSQPTATKVGGLVMSEEEREVAATQAPGHDEREQQPSSQSARTPARKSIGARLSNVPDVISPWFSPKRSLATDAEKTSAAVKLQQDTIFPPLRRIHTNGVSTAHAYFTPLSRLEDHLNPSSQLSYGTQTVDVFAIVTNGATDPARAKSGPRDYYTTLRIADSSVSPTLDVRVEVFRPWKATLPVAKVGDVVLLRAFAVKSRKRQPYLLSTDASAWCVWRHKEVSDDDGRAEKPVWARRASEQVDGAVREEIKGPPVEFGEAEREHARELRLWWEGMASGKAGVEGYDDDNRDDDADDAHEVGLNGHGLQAVAAKL